MTQSRPENPPDTGEARAKESHAKTWRLRPRFRGLAIAAIVVGAAAIAAAGAGLVTPAYRVWAIVAGGVGVVLGAAYLRSPAWRTTVTVGDGGLEVRRPGASILELRWSEVERAVLGPGRATLYVDGGGPERSLLIPGPGATAPYDIENKSQLIDEILRRLPDSVVEPQGDVPAADSTDV